MERIFLLDTPYDEPISKEEADIIETNIKTLNVTVHVASETKGLDPKLQRYFLAEKSAIIAWEAHIISAGQISRVDVTTVPEDIKIFCGLFEEIKGEYSKRVYGIINENNERGEKIYKLSFDPPSDS